MLSTARHFLDFWVDSCRVGGSELGQQANHAIRLCQRETEFGAIPAHLFGAAAFKWTCSQVPASTEILTVVGCIDSAMMCDKEVMDSIVCLMDMYIQERPVLYMAVTQCA
jgi:hypothetical protein